MDLSDFLNTNGHRGSFSLLDPAPLETPGLVEYAMHADVVDGKIQSFCCFLHRFDSEENAKAFAAKFKDDYFVNGPFVLALMPAHRGGSQLPYAFSQFRPYR